MNSLISKINWLGTGLVIGFALSFLGAYAAPDTLGDTNMRLAVLFGATALSLLATRRFFVAPATTTAPASPASRPAHLPPFGIPAAMPGLALKKNTPVPPKSDFHGIAPIKVDMGAATSLTVESTKQDDGSTTVTVTATGFSGSQFKSKIRPRLENISGKGITWSNPINLGEGTRKMVCTIAAGADVNAVLARITRS